MGGSDGRVLQVDLEDLEQQVVGQRELDRDFAFDGGRRHALQGGGPGDVADAALGLDLQDLKPGPVGLGRQTHILQVLLLQRGQRHRRRLHADLLVDEALRQRHAGVVAAAPHRGVLAGDRVELVAAQRRRRDRLDQVDRVVLGGVDRGLVGIGAGAEQARGLLVGIGDRADGGAEVGGDIVGVAVVG